MPAIRGLTVAVGEQYAYTLSIALPLNMRHMTECLVITTPADEAVKDVARSVPGVRVYETDEFYAHGAAFNKGLCIERAFDVLGREGWILIHDSDVIFPDELPLDALQVGTLHGIHRRILANPSHYQPGLNWNAYPVHRDGGPVGFFQLFHAADPALRGKPWWYDPSFPHAGGGDAAFMAYWPRNRWRVFPVACLHLGLPDTNWFTASAEGRDLMAKFVHQNGWRRAMQVHSREAVERAGELPDRIQVPGFAPSSYELPFVRRTQASRGV